MLKWSKDSRARLPAFSGQQIRCEATLIHPFEHPPLMHIQPPDPICLKPELRRTEAGFRQGFVQGGKAFCASAKKS
jgi:hypothetical protein